MGVSVTFEPATVAHAEALAPLMRAEDLAECQALGYPTAHEALLVSLKNADIARAMLFDGEVAALFGLAVRRSTVLGSSDVGLVWLLSGRAVARHPSAFLRHSRPVLAALLQHCATLGNCIDARYTGALRWAMWLGFDIGRPVALGPAGMPFCPVTITRAKWRAQWEC